MTAASPPTQPAATSIAGILLMLAAVMLFASMDTMAKYLGRYYPVPNLVWARYTVHFLFMLVFLGPRLRYRLLRTSHLALQILRALLLLGSTAFFFTALRFLPLAEASAIGFVTPLLVTAFSVPLLGEKVGPRRWTAVLIGFAGVLIVLHPGSGLLTWAAVLPLSSSLCFSLYQIITRKLSASEDPFATLFYAALVGALVTSAALPFEWVSPTSLFHGLLILLLGLLGGISHFILIKAFERASAAVLAPFGYTQLVYTTLLGYLVFGSFPDQLSVAGMLVIAGSGLYVAYREALLRRAPG